VRCAVLVSLLTPPSLVRQQTTGCSKSKMQQMFDGRRPFFETILQRAGLDAC
jgi:hypothetical protein